MKKTIYGVVALFGLMASALAIVGSATAADHLEAPLVQQDGRTDINDIYAFQSPTNPDNTVLIMTVNPGAGVLSPTTFRQGARYRFRIDHDGDARQDDLIQVRFGRVRSDGSQRVMLRGAGGKAKGWTGEDISLGNGGWLRAGSFDDPFFFDFVAFEDQVKGAGGSRTFCDGAEADFFAGLNVSGIVVEVPSSALTNGDTSIGVWGETSTRSKRIDQMGRPAINTVLIDDGSEDRFNLTRPRHQLSKFGDQVRDNLLFLSGLDGTGYTEAEAEGVAAVLLPDILTVDVSSTDPFLNGRGLPDDVIDTALTVVTGGLGANGTPVLTSDCVDANDVAFPGTFPYLAPAH